MAYTIANDPGFIRSISTDALAYLPTPPADQLDAKTVRLATIEECASHLERTFGYYQTAQLLRALAQGSGQGGGE